jgi:ArsR family transcriptional regulator, arsenate/arsenite/antimonite-responsive transcriptional repressor
MSKPATDPAPSRPTPEQDAPCCDPLAVRALTPAQAALLAPMFKALADPVRLRLMSMIASRPEACVCDLTGAFAVSGPTISHHLRVLREAGLVGSSRRGTWVYYRVRPEAVRQLGALLDITPGARK